MELLNNIWIYLSTENELLTSILYIPLAFMEATVYMLLFTTILNIECSRKQKLIYIIVASMLGVISSILVPKPLANIITFIFFPIAVMFIFKVNIVKAIFSEFIPIIIVVILEVFISKIFYVIFNYSYELCANIPVFRLVITLIIYFVIFLIYKIAMHFNFNIDAIGNINKKNKKTILINVSFGLIVIFIQMYLVGYYNDKLPSFIVLINIFILIAYCIINLYSIIKSMKLEKTSEDLEQEKLYNKTLQILHDNVRTFKHDFSNIVASIGGYIETEDLIGLKKYYKQLLQDCHLMNNLSSLSPNMINNPAVYAILANKYYAADNAGIKINLECFIDFNNLHMGIYEFSKILGILMDNAIEASSECPKKLIDVVIREDYNQSRQLLIIKNTYLNKKVDINKIYEKGFSTKANNTGLGLWEVNKIISKHKNLARFTTKSKDFFEQQIEIYSK